MDEEAIICSLREQGIPETLAHKFPRLPQDARGLLLYGSRARGDAVSDSDVDLLALVQESRPSVSTGLLNISFYTKEQLSTGIGTLFGFHLKRDCVILQDTTGELSTALNGMGDVDTERLLVRALRMSTLFTCGESNDQNLWMALGGVT